MERILDASAYYEKNSDYRKILDAIENPVIILNLDMQIVFMNQAQEKILGGAREEFVGKPCSVFGTPNCGTEMCCVVCGLKGKYAVQTLKDGTTYRISVSVLHNKEGDPCGYISISSDITELVQAKKNLELSEEQYRDALMKTRSSIWEYDVQKKSLKSLGMMLPMETRVFDQNAEITDVPESFIRNEIIHPDSVDALMELYRDVVAGTVKRSYMLRLKARKQDAKYCWLGIVVSLICDQKGRVLKAIGVSRDMTREHEIQQKYEKEHEYRKLLMKDAIGTYEVNLTQDRILSVKDDIEGVCLGTAGERYSQVLEMIISRYVNEDYRKLVRDMKNPENLMEKYARGEKMVFCEYPIWIQEGGERWVESYSYLQKSEEGDICAFVYLKDIDKRKQQELKLKEEAQLDHMTSLYNRTAFRALVNQSIEEEPDAPHAFAIVDIDNFKQINDNFGHLYGDAVLSEIASKIQVAFRKSDIVGRLGGDEFAVFFKCMSDERVVLERIEKLRKEIQTEYVTGDARIRMSASIGVSFAPRHGDTFEILYENADRALYYVKNEGKDAVSVYSQGMQMGGTRRKAAESRDVVPLEKDFQNNVEEYVFKILYYSKDLYASLQSVLQLIGRHYNMGRCYIVEYQPVSGRYQVTFEWHADEMEGIPEAYWSIKKEQMEGHYLRFDESGMLFVEDVGNADEDMKQYGSETGCKALFQCAIMDDQKLRGIIGMDDTRNAHGMKASDMAMFETISEIIETFLMTRRKEDQRDQYIKSLWDILNLQTSYIYMIQPETYEIVAYNKETQRLYPEIQAGDFCYRRFKDQDRPCETCPVKNLQQGEETSMEIYDDIRKAWVCVNATWIDWLEYGRCVAIESMDITKYKKLS